MRLRLFDRIRRLARRGADTLSPGRDRARDTGQGRHLDHAGQPVHAGQAGTRGPRSGGGHESAGRHRKGAADAAPPERGAVLPQRPQDARPGPALSGPGTLSGPGALNGPGEPGAAGGGPANSGAAPGGARVVGGDGGPSAAGGVGGTGARSRRPGTGGGVGRARVREAPYGTAPVPPADTVARRAPAEAVAREPWYQVVAGPAATRQAPAPRVPGAMAAMRAARGALRSRLPFAVPHPQGQPATADGRRNCGALETVLWRQWDPAVPPPPEVIAAIDRLAEFPQLIKEKLALGLDGIYVGPGGVPELDDMTGLRGVPLPSGRATWDACAGAYGERKIVVGSRPSPTPDVMCHEVGHALDDLDSPPGKWQSDSAQFRMLYDQCQSHLASDFHRQPGGLGRKEFFADAFAAIASRQRPALVDMLGGDTRTALRVMLYFNRRYGI